MKTRYLVLALFGVLATAAFAAPPVVTVTYVDPDKFTDVKYDYIPNAKEREHILGELKKYIEERAAKRLPDGSKLDVTVTDVDMAGGFDMPAGASGLWRTRLVKDIYPPRMNLAFKLTGDDGKTVSEGERKLVDLGFLMGNYSMSSDMLRFEKKMLDAWISKEFPGAPKAAANARAPRP
ncbi:DUF3016 domain-containing protein [Usitatibacter palustris]|uniref:DUF3016 domain-containing protein n=1 Tax=Usitatibacter palustris TaxID=2732487 RepID=A0A6M4H692_9PROT|nr:DUF3016 domain-containing protein [Usitatibacter palustris]QJR15159.1 hypothetical protein DSM104440_01976 [Usitatibacter palustris]